MTKLITCLVFATAAALAVPAMAASHAGGAPMKASEPAGKASAPAKKHSKSTKSTKSTHSTTAATDATKEDPAKK